MFCRVLLALFLSLYPLAVQAEDLTGQIRVAVLPFATPAGNVVMQQYGPGTMDSLIAGLSNVPQFIMIDRGRIERVIQEQASLQTGLVDAQTAVKLGHILGAQAVISGTMQAFNGQIRISANFIDVATAAVKDREQVTGTNLFDLQEQVVGLFIKSQHLSVTPGQQQRIANVIKSTASVTAYDDYLKGRKAYLLFTPAGYAEAVKWYNQAIQTDPKYALAYAGLAEAWDYWGWQKQQNEEDPQSNYEQAYAAAQQALQLNPDLAAAHRAYGMASSVLGKPGWEAEVRRAVELNPSDAENWYDLWAATNSNDPDHEYIRKALQLNPDLSVAHGDRGDTLLRLKRYDEAIAEFREVLRLNPDDAIAHMNLGKVLHDLQRNEEATQEYELYLKYAPNAANAEYLRSFIKKLRSQL